MANALQIVSPGQGPFAVAYWLQVFIYMNLKKITALPVVRIRSKELAIHIVACKKPHLGRSSHCHEVECRGVLSSLSTSTTPDAKHEAEVILIHRIRDDPAISRYIIRLLNDQLRDSFAYSALRNSHIS